MALFKKVADGMLYKGGMIGAGILGVLLWRGRYLPVYTGVISLCLTSVGFCSAFWYMWRTKEKKPDSSTVESKDQVVALYKEAVSKLGERLSDQEAAVANEDKEGKGQTLNGNEESDQVADGRTSEGKGQTPDGSEESGQVADGRTSEGKGQALDGSEESGQVADGTASSSEGTESAKSPIDKILVLKKGNSLKFCADTFRQNGISEAAACKVDEANYHVADISDLSILADEVDEAVFRELTLKELEPLAESEGLARGLFMKEGKAEDGTSEDCEGEVFQASQLFKDWDARRPDVEKELAALSTRGRGANLGKAGKGASTKPPANTSRKNKKKK